MRKETTLYQASSAPLRIMHIISSFGLGGAESVAIGLACQQSYHHKVAVVALLPSKVTHSVVRDQNIKRLASAGVAVIELDTATGGAELCRGLLRLVRLFGRWKPHLVHTHTDIPDFFTSLARRITKIRVARTIHNTVLWPGRKTIPKIVEAGFREDLVVAVSQDAMDAYLELRQRVGLEASPHLAVCWNGLPAVGHDRQAVSELLGSTTPKIQIGFVGRLVHQKGGDLLLSALSSLAPDLLNQIHLYVLGDGPDREALQEIQQELALPITFLGVVANARRVFGGFDFMIVPSRFEGCPLVAMEAHIAGVPVIITDAPGLRALKRHPGTVVCRSEDVRSLADAISNCVKNLPQLKDEAAGAVAAAAKLYSEEKFAKVYEDLYLRYLGYK